ncbi:MAG TPA: M56 family metallopeptidase, partial [Longimicrobiaceae bacterium]|nr:M56 family metallopeptidase [Longimicrobiaceae bacterium]
MIAAWMLYAVLVSVLVAAAARGVEEACRVVRLPVRWVWLGALAVMLALLAAAPLRPADPVLPVSTRTAAPGGMAGLVRVKEERSLAAGLVAEARSMGRAAFRGAAEIGEGRGGWMLGAGWAALSLALVAAGAATLGRYRAARRLWPLRRVGNTRVRVAPAAGPAVLGVLRPEIVVPAWLLRAAPDQRRLALMHEREHLAARDPLLLAAGCIAVALVPWNPAAWWMLRRLRVAVELDCDARVLRRGAPRQAYGLLLIDIAGRGSGLSLGVAAVAGSPSTLERRLVAMTARFSRVATLRAGLLGVLGAAALFAACDTQMPTAAEIDALDLSRA